MKILASLFKTPMLYWAILLTIAACLGALFWQLYSGKELLYESFAVLLGVIITAIITMILLSGQTKLQLEADSAKERNQKVYEEKLKIYQAFLENLCNTLKDGKIDKEEKNKLIFDTASICMHTSLAHVEEISKGVQALVQTTNDIPTEATEKGKIEKDKLEALFRIVNCFRQELYTNGSEEDKKHANELTDPRLSPTRESIKESFSAAFEVLSDEDEAPSSRITLPETADVPNWETAQNIWKAQGWVYTDKSKEPSGYAEFELRHPALPASVMVGIHAEHYYFRADYEGTTVFSRDIKRRYKKGRRTYGTWWYHFEGAYYDIPKGSFAEKIQTDTALLNYTFKSINVLLQHLQEQHEVLSWWKGVEERVKASHPEWLADPKFWQMDSWDLRVFYCNYKKESEGTPFMDIYRDDSGKTVRIELANRQGKDDLLELTLSRVLPNPEERQNARTPNNRILLREIHHEHDTEECRKAVSDAIFEYMCKLAS